MDKLDGLERRIELLEARTRQQAERNRFWLWFLTVYAIWTTGMEKFVEFHKEALALWALDPTYWKVQLAVIAVSVACLVFAFVSYALDDRLPWKLQEALFVYRRPFRWLRRRE